MPACYLPRGTSYATAVKPSARIFSSGTVTPRLPFREQTCLHNAHGQMWRRWQWHHHSCATIPVLPQITAENEPSCPSLMRPGGGRGVCGNRWGGTFLAECCSKKDNELRTQCAWNTSSLSHMPSNQDNHSEPRWYCFLMLYWLHASPSSPPSDCLCLSLDMLLRLQLCHEAWGTHVTKCTTLHKCYAWWTEPTTPCVFVFMLLSLHCLHCKAES